MLNALQRLCPLHHWLTTFDRVGQGDILTSPVWSVATREVEEPLIFSLVSVQGDRNAQ